MALPDRLAGPPPRTRHELFEFGTSLASRLVEENRFFRAWTPGRIERPTADSFFRSLDRLVASFPRLIALGAARAEDVETRAVLATNLYQECGEGDPRRSHHAIYRAFLDSATGVRSPSAGCRAAARWYDELAGYVLGVPSSRRAIAALAAGEFLAQPALGRIYAVVGHLYADADVEYFTTHLVREDEHVCDITEALSRRLATPSQRRDVAEGLREGGRIWSDYFEAMSRSLPGPAGAATR